MEWVSVEQRDATCNAAGVYPGPGISREGLIILRYDVLPQQAETIWFRYSIAYTV